MTTQMDRIRAMAHDRGLYIGDETKHDPHTGRFTSAAGHEAAAEHHAEEADYHADLVREHGTGRAKSMHGLAETHHQRAMQAHRAAARTFGRTGAGYEHHAEKARKASRVAAAVSRSAKAVKGDSSLRTTDPGVEKTMHEFKRGTLRSGSKRGPKVTSRKQAIAIGLSKQRRGDGLLADAVQQMDRIRQKMRDRFWL